MDRPAPVGSNYQAAAQLQRRLLDSIFLETRYLDPVEPDTGLTLFGVKMKTPVFCSALSKPGNQLSDEEMVDLVRGMGQGWGDDDAGHGRCGHAAAGHRHRRPRGEDRQAVPDDRPDIRAGE